MKTTEFLGLELTVKKETLELYIHDLSKQIKNIKTALPINIELMQKPIPLENSPSSMIIDHLASGQNIFVAFHQDKPVGYIFSTNSKCWVGEIHDHLKVATREIYLFNAYIYGTFRCKKIYQALITHVLRYYKNRSYKQALIFTIHNNNTSRKGIENAGFEYIGCIRFSDFLGRKSWQYSRRTSDSQSYFLHEAGENE